MLKKLLWNCSETPTGTQKLLWNCSESIVGTALKDNSSGTAPTRRTWNNQRIEQENCSETALAIKKNALKAIVYDWLTSIAQH